MSTIEQLLNDFLGARPKGEKEKPVAIDAVDRAVWGLGKLKLIDDVSDKLLDNLITSEEDKLKVANQRLELIERSKRLGITPKQAMDKAVLKEPDKAENAARIAVLLKAGLKIKPGGSFGRVFATLKK